MTEVRSQPCSACPYRRDVPSGVWSWDEYEKLRPYDNPTGEQPFEGFACHMSEDHYCYGWALCHTSRGNEFDLLALRLSPPSKLPKATVELFVSGNDAADYGQEQCDEPSEDACQTVAKLMRKNSRLQYG